TVIRLGIIFIHELKAVKFLRIKYCRIAGCQLLIPTPAVVKIYFRPINTLTCNYSVCGYFYLNNYPHLQLALFCNKESSIIEYKSLLRTAAMRPLPHTAD
ncbi:hypothetical protein, partial [Mixta tenebrionis]|uniref:hypothetical protein n=1 Tax=Mixta tenebrionis TaxID=2562439 RepID=UPI001C701736